MLRQLSPRKKLSVTVAIYLLWTTVTWFLEGRLLTLLRPEAVVDRLVYTGIANVIVGTLLALWVMGEFVTSGFTSRPRLGFASLSRSLVLVLLAGVGGLGFYLVQEPPSTDPIVVLNAFAQVFTVSVAEIVVCWVVVGGSFEALLRGREVNRYVAGGVALVVSSVLFGVYHLAHSPPFNTLGMIGVLTVVSIGTGMFYFVGRSTYGALVFHNFLALFGVTSALADAGQLDTFHQPQFPLLVSALVAFVVLIAAERRFVRKLP